MDARLDDMPVSYTHLDVYKRQSINDGIAGLRVVQLLEAAEKSLKERGKLVELSKPFSAGV